LCTVTKKVVGVFVRFRAPHRSTFDCRLEQEPLVISASVVRHVAETGYGAEQFDASRTVFETRDP
jgi:hypothetical protein